MASGLLMCMIERLDVTVVMDTGTYLNKRQGSFYNILLWPKGIMSFYKAENSCSGARRS